MHAPMQHLELFIRRHGIEETRRLGAVDGCLKGSSHPPTRSTVPDGQGWVALYGHDRPLVQFVQAGEWEVERLLTRYVQALYVVEYGIDLRLRPQLVDRDERVGEGRDASHVPDGDAPPGARPVARKCREISDAFDALRFAVDTGHGVEGGSNVDEVAGNGVAMP